jgi:D-arabinose 1-dehydrogenase-like Zn-dependent alcohol dehydrogenase
MNIELKDLHFCKRTLIFSIRQVGDHVGIGYYIDSCLECDACLNHLENVCEKHNTGTACSAIRFGRVGTDNGRYTYGGFSDKITAHRRFLTKIAKSYPLQLAGPIFCSGITMFTPLKRFGATKGGLNVGILGLGGLGQMGLKLAKAMGNTVTAISTNRKKEETARELGADHFVVSSDPESMAAASRSLDLVLNTISAPHQVSAYFPLMKRNGTIVLLGAVFEPMLVRNIEHLRAISPLRAKIGTTEL